MIKRRILLVGKDKSLWDFTELTGMPHPHTDDQKELEMYAKAAVKSDPSLKKFVIVEVEV